VAGESVSQSLLNMRRFSRFAWLNLRSRPQGRVVADMLLRGEKLQNLEMFHCPVYPKAKNCAE
jgi:hypothetical protein